MIAQYGYQKKTCSAPWWVVLLLDAIKEGPHKSYGAPVYGYGK